MYDEKKRPLLYYLADPKAPAGMPRPRHGLRQKPDIPRLIILSLLFCFATETNALSQNPF